jgi:adenine-specific DNA-methyltransferase
MARRKPAPPTGPASDYRHDGVTRPNLPPAGLASEGAVPVVKTPQFAYNPHRPPELRFDAHGHADKVEEILAKAAHAPLSKDEIEALRSAARGAQQPWLEWAGKRERPGFAVDPVALHLHERVSAQACVAAAGRADIDRTLFGDPEQNFSEAVQFYKHQVEWSNRLILGDSLQVMASLSAREELAGKVQMIYIDPPYGIKFGSNFQPEVGKRDVKDKESDLTREPEMVRAYRDTWHLGLHSYLGYLRDRLKVAKALLTDSGSVFVQIGIENLHTVRLLLDELFGRENAICQISFATTSGIPGATLSRTGDYLLWYAKHAGSVKYRQLFKSKEAGDEGAGEYRYLMAHNSELRNLTEHELSGRATTPPNSRRWRHGPLTSSGHSNTGSQPFNFRGNNYSPGPNNHWKTNHVGLTRLARADLLIARPNSLSYMLFADWYPVLPLTATWLDTKWGFDAGDKAYVVQTTSKVVERCLLMTTDPGDLVLDPTCGSGTTAYVAEQWGRRWITIDTSRVAVAIARQRLLTAKFDYYTLRNEEQGIDGGLVYKKVPHVTLKSIAQNPNLDPVFAKHEPLLDAALLRCNAALAGVSAELRTKLGFKLAAKEKTHGKRAVTDADRRRWELPAFRGVPAFADAL